MVERKILCTARELRKIKLLFHFITNPIPFQTVSKIKEALFDNQDFIKLHLSLVYPFTSSELEKYANKIVWGSLYYTSSVWDIRKTSAPEFAALGLSFNPNLSAFCSWEETLAKYNSNFEQPANPKASRYPPLHLVGELEDRFATRLSSYSRNALLPDYIGEMYADSIVIAHSLYYQDEIINAETLQRFLYRYGKLAAFNISLWDELLIWYMTPSRFDEIMAEL